MATDVRKFLDSAGVGILWNAITAELNKKAIADNVYTKKEVDDKIAAVPTYDDTELKADVKANTDAIAVLNGEAGEEGSVAYKITKMVLEADENNATDKIAEIAAWIANHPTDAAEYNQRIATNAADIEALEKLVGNTAVATQIANAIAAEDITTKLGNYYTKSTQNRHYCSIFVKKKMKYKVEKYIEKHQLIEKGSTVLVALSGGADSVALLLVLYNLGLLSFTEIKREFATLKVLGFKSSQLRKLLLTQNLWFTTM